MTPTCAFSCFGNLAKRELMSFSTVGYLENAKTLCNKRLPSWWPSDLTAVVKADKSPGTKCGRSGVALMRLLSLGWGSGRGEWMAPEDGECFPCGGVATLRGGGVDPGVIAHSGCNSKLVHDGGASQSFCNTVTAKGLSEGNSSSILVTRATGGGPGHP